MGNGPNSVIWCNRYYYDEYILNLAQKWNPHKSMFNKDWLRHWHDMYISLQSVYIE